MYSKNYDNLFINKRIHSIQYNIVFFSLIFFLYFEYFFIFTIYTSYKTKNFFFFYPNRITVLLIFCFLYFIYIWGISNWRRTQYGKFTRGDRKLWSKSYASFWIVEFTTILGIFGAACWMNWGPTVLIPRKFAAVRKGFIFEVTIFTYILWLIYLLRFSLKWNKWQTQQFIVYFILILTFCLIWRDLLVIFGRENINVRNGARWKYITSQVISYTLSPVWWYNHFINQNSKLDYSSYYYSLKTFLKNLENQDYSSIFIKNNSFNLYNKLHFLPYIESDEWKTSTYFDMNLLNSNYRLYSIENFSFSVYDINEKTMYSYKYYPRRIGSHYKKIAIWTLLLFLKMWHHTMLFIWWLFYNIKIVNKKKNSYSYLSICYFNLYCCFLISLLIYLMNYLTFYERFFKIIKTKPSMRTRWKTKALFSEAFTLNLLLMYYFVSKYFSINYYRNLFSLTKHDQEYFIKQIPLNFIKRFYNSEEELIFFDAKSNRYILRRHFFPFNELVFFKKKNSFTTYEFLKTLIIKGPSFI